MNLLFLGDWGRMGEHGQCHVAQGMARWAARHKLDAIVTTGDNFYEHGVESTADAHWESSFRQVYHQPELDAPWYPTLGNHDYAGDPDAQLAWSSSEPRWNFPDRYYSVDLPLADGATLQLVMLDTTPMIEMYRGPGFERLAGVREVDPRDQLDWFDATMAATRPEWRIVVGHHPIYSGSPMHGSTPELQRLLMPRLRDQGVAAYVCGHEHDLQHIADGDIHHLLSGAGSQWRPTGKLLRTRFSHAGLGFLSCHATADSLDFRFHDASARELHAIRMPGRERLRVPLPLAG